MIAASIHKPQFQIVCLYFCNSFYLYFMFTQTAYFFPHCLTLEKLNLNIVKSILSFCIKTLFFGFSYNSN